MPVLAVTAALASCTAPFGYQTNLMVCGPGRYHFVDYLRMGMPLSVLVAVVSLVLIPMAWEF